MDLSKEKCSLSNLLQYGDKKYMRTVRAVVRRNMRPQHCVMEKSGMIIFCTSMHGQQNKVRAGRQLYTGLQTVVAATLQIFCKHFCRKPPGGATRREELHSVLRRTAMQF